MKKVLVTGAAGSIGEWVLKYLLSEGKYEITALDLKNKESSKRLKKYQKRVNVIYGDIEDQVLIDALVKDHDYIIHLAGIMPPLSNLSVLFGNNIDFIGTENIVKSISFYNPECFFLYPSTTEMYEYKNTEVSTSTKEKILEEDYYSKNKLKCEKLIKDKIKNYVIFRMPFVLGDLKRDKAIFLYKKNIEIELITNRDAAYGLVKAIECKKELNKKTKILNGGKGCRVNSTELYIRILDIYGYTFNRVWNFIFKPFVYQGHIFKEEQKIEDLLKYQNDSIDSYFMRLKRTNTKRNIMRIIAKPFKKIIEKDLNK